MGDCGHAHNCGGHLRSSVHQTMDEMEFERGIWSAAMDGELSSVEKFLRRGVDVNCVDTYGYTALHYASRNGHKEVCKLLVENKANCNSMTKAGKITPVHRAANRGHLEILRLLIKHGGNPSIQDSDGKNSLHKAAETGQREIITYLLQLDPTLITQLDTQGRSPRDCLPGNCTSLSELFESAEIT